MSLDQRSTIISEYRSKALVEEWFWHGTRHESVRLRLDSVERIIGGLFLFYVWTVQLGWDNIFRERQKAIFLAEWRAVGHLMGFLPGWVNDLRRLRRITTSEGSHSSAGALIRGWGSTWSEDTRSRFPWLVRAEKEMVDACIGPSSHAFSLGLGGHMPVMSLLTRTSNTQLMKSGKSDCKTARTKLL